MIGSSLKITLGPITYFVDDPKAGDGLKATVSAVSDVGADGAPVRTLHRDRLNLDRSRDRAAFARAAGTNPDDLNQVRDRVLDFLAPAPQADADDTKVDDPVAQEAAEALLASPDLLEQVEQVVRTLGYAGDRGLPLLIYLAFVSRLLPRPINLVVTGPSAAGKSFAVMLVARLFPPAAFYALNGMSERLLAYTDADLRHRTLVIGEASALERDGIGASLLRSVAWEGSVSYETVEKTAAGLKARRIEKPGPTGFITTTTGRVEPELGTRVLVAHVPDDRETTRTILLATAARANGHRPEEPDLAPWHAVQRLLAAGEHTVTIPFAVVLAAVFQADQVRSRRDFVQLLGLVQAHALLFREQRARDALGRIVADHRDYTAVFALTAPIFGAIAADGVTPIVRETVAAVDRLVPDAGAPAVTVNQVAAGLGVHKSVASRRITLAVKGGWLVNEETRRGRPLQLRPGDALPDEVLALPHPTVLFAEPAGNRATVQPSENNPPVEADFAVASGCEGGCPVAIASGETAPPAAAVAERLQTPAQPSFWSIGAESQPEPGTGCTVASGLTIAANDLPRTDQWRRCVDCGTPLPDGWIALYCERHGGATSIRHQHDIVADQVSVTDTGLEDVWL